MTLVIIANSHLEMKPILIILTPLLLAPLATLNAVEPITNSIGMKLVPIAPGHFQMGQDGPQTDYDMRKHPGESDRADWDEKPVHQVKISKPLRIARSMARPQRSSGR